MLVLISSCLNISLFWKGFNGAKVPNFSPTMEDWFAGEKFGEYAANGPDVDRLKRKKKKMKVVFNQKHNTFV